jgi:hypothetical protein
MTLGAFIKQISFKEWRLISIVWFVLSILSLIPFLFTLPHLYQGYYLTGVHSIAYGDMNVYLSYIRQVFDGRYLFETLFTATTADLLMFRPDWLLIGLFGKLFALSPLVTFHVARILLSGFLLVVLYIFLKYVLTEIPKSKFVFLLFSFTTGIGLWLILPIQLSFTDYAQTLFWPIDLWVPEAFIFLSIINSPHFIFSWLLLILGYLLYWFVIDITLITKKRFYYAIYLGLVLGILFLTHPFHVLPVVSILLLHFLYICWKNKKFEFKIFYHLVIAGAISFFGIFYHLFYLGNDWLTAVKVWQNDTPTPNFLMIMAGFILLPLAILEFYNWIANKKNFDDKKVFIIIFFVVQLILIYLPFPWQRRMLQGWQLPILILAGSWLWKRWSKFILKKDFFFSYKFIVIILLSLFILLPTSFYNIVRDGYYYAVKDSPFYYTASYYEGLKNLRLLTDSQSRILSHPSSGNYIVGITGRHVLVGHGVESAYMDAFVPLLELFFKDNNQPDKKILRLKEWGITHIFYSSYEKELGVFDPSLMDYLKMEYTNDEVQIYKVIPELLR